MDHIGIAEENFNWVVNYLQNIDELNKQYEDRLTDPELMEKFAREKYFMKKDTEDLFIVIEK